MTNDWSTTAARLRERIAFGVSSSERIRIASPNPGSSTRMISRIASGVKSRAAIPVPPVVRIKPQPCALKARMVVLIFPSSSGMTASPCTTQPYCSAAARTAGPPRSSYCPAEARSEMVMMPTVMAMRLALLLREQTDVGDFHGFVHRFAHVVNRQEGQGHPGERLHFHAGLRGGARGALRFHHPVA